MRWQEREILALVQVQSEIPCEDWIIQERCSGIGQTTPAGWEGLGKMESRGVVDLICFDCGPLLFIPKYFTILDQWPSN